MTVPISDVEDNLRTAILAGGTNTRVVFVAPNAPRPELPYTMIEYLTAREAGNIFDWTCFDQETQVNRLYGPRVLVFTIKCFGENSIDEANQLKAAFGYSQMPEALEANGLVSMALQDVGAVDYGYVLRDDTYEKQAFFDIILNVVLEDGTSTEDTGFFDTINDPSWSNFDDNVQERSSCQQ